MTTSLSNPQLSSENAFYDVTQRCCTWLAAALAVHLISESQAQDTTYPPKKDQPTRVTLSLVGLVAPIA